MLGRLKPDTTGSSHSGCPASDFSTFSLIRNISLHSFLGQSDAHYSSKRYIISWRITGGGGSERLDGLYS